MLEPDQNQKASVPSEQDRKSILQSPRLDLKIDKEIKFVEAGDDFLMPTNSQGKMQKNFLIRTDELEYH
jgi:hypothetical protein